MAYKVHTYSALLRQIHNDLRLQHPEWIQPNGESPMCDSYEARLIELLDASMQTAPNETIAVPDCFLEHGGSTKSRPPQKRIEALGVTSQNCARS